MGKHRAASALVHRGNALHFRPKSPLHRTQTRAVLTVFERLFPAPLSYSPMALWYALNDPVLSQLERTLDCMLQE